MRARVAALLTALSWSLACSQNVTLTSASDGGSGGLSINVPSSNIDCDVAVPIENSAPPSAADALCDPSSPTASFTSDVAPISASCAGEVCHLPWTYDSLVGVHSAVCCDRRFLVDPYAPSSSALIQALLDTNPCVGQMPPGAPLAKSDIDPVIAWICQGAQRN
jgi:hypothetical protein